MDPALLDVTARIPQRQACATATGVATLLDETAVQLAVRRLPGKSADTRSSRCSWSSAQISFASCSNSADVSGEVHSGALTGKGAGDCVPPFEQHRVSSSGIGHGLGHPAGELRA